MCGVDNQRLAVDNQHKKAALSAAFLIHGFNTSKYYLILLE